MRKKGKILINQLTCLLVFLCGMRTFTVFAQDPHYSQFYNNTLALNPGFTGALYNSSRINLQHREQWPLQGSFSSTVLTGDMTLLEDKFKKFDYLGIGILANREAFGENFRNNVFVFSAAYHKFLGGKAQHYLSLGVQMGLSNLSINQDGLTDGESWVSDYGVVSDLSALSDDPLYQNQGLASINNFDAHIGLVYNFVLAQKHKIYLGFSSFNILHNSLTTKSTGLESSVSYNKEVYQAGGKIRLNQNFYLFPRLYLISQNQLVDFNSGMSLEYYLNPKVGKEIMFSVGGWARPNDGVIFTMGFKFKKYTVGYSMDLINDNLAKAVGRRGGYEISFGAVFGKKQKAVSETNGNEYYLY